MKSKSIFLFLVIFLLTANAVSQTIPAFIISDTINVFLGSGENNLLIPQVSDGDNQSQSISFTAQSLDLSILEVSSVDYTLGDLTAILVFSEKMKAGITGIKITASDVDGSFIDTLYVRVTPYSNPGARFQIHDAVFWQQLIPYNLPPVYEQWIPTGEGPWSELNYDEIPMTVNGDCVTSPPCTGHDFYTAYWQGYFIPSASGDYTFYMKAGDQFCLFLSPDDQHDNAVPIIYTGSKLEKTGTDIGNGEWQAADINLQEGVPYAFYGVQWIIHTTTGGIMVEGPGLTKDYIAGENMMPVYDPVKPQMPSDLNASTTGSEFVILNWGNGTDNQEITGYEVFINGQLYNEELITENHLQLSSLTPGETYSFAIRAVDKMANRSLFSNILTLTTWQSDLNPPLPPDNLETMVSTGVAVKLKWSGATDNDSEIIGYNLYIADTLYNVEGPVYSDTIIISGLLPETEETIQIEALDASLNVSQKSQVFTFTTSAFDPFGIDLGEKLARVFITEEAISYNNGIGLNGPYESGQMVNDPVISSLVREFKAGAIRWGAISANSKSLNGSTGTGKSNTYGRMLNFANELDAYFALTVGVQDGIDYREDLNSFSNLLEYLEGPPTSEWGAKRAAEGFTEPLLSKGKGIILEFGNEVWGADAHDAQIGKDYNNYGNWCREAAEVLKSSPYYDPDKIIMAYSGRNPHPGMSYGLHELVLSNDTGNIECLAVSGYLGGNLDLDPGLPEWDRELQYYKIRTDQVAYDIEGFQLTMKNAMKQTGSLKKFYLYESNSTTNSYNGRLGQAIVMMDLFAESMKYGSIVPSVFHLTGGEWKITRPTENYKPLPLFITGKVFNTYCKGDVLNTEIETKQVITNGFNSPIDYDPIGVTAYRNQDNLAVLCLSRDFDNDYTLELNMPDDFVYSGKVAIMTYTGQEAGTIDLDIDSVNLDYKDKMLIDVPKYGMVLISFVDYNREMTNLPLGYFSYKPADEVYITPKTEKDITSDSERLYYTAGVLPEDAFFKHVKFKVIDNGVEIVHNSPSSNYYYIKGSGTCEGNGTVHLMAYAVDNPEISTSLDINISNQGSCNVSIEDYSAGISFFPNPAENEVKIEKFKEGILTIISMQGKVLLSHDLRTGNHVNLSDLPNGIYLIKIKTLSGTETSRLIKN